MAWKLHAIEQMQLRRQHRVGGVGRPKFDFHTAAHPTRGRSADRDQRVAVRHLGQSAAAGAEALRMSRRYAPFFMIRPGSSLAVDAAVGHTFTFRAPQHPPAGLLAVAAEEHLLFRRRLLRSPLDRVFFREPSYGHLDAGYIYCGGLLLHVGCRVVDGVFWCSLCWAASMQALYHNLRAIYSLSYSSLAVLRGQGRRSREDNQACVCETLASAPENAGWCLW